MKKYKALVVDFDNTLADPCTLLIDNKVKEKILHLINSGNKFSIITGRPFTGTIENVCVELGLTIPQVVHGGGEIVMPLSGKVVWGKYIDPAELSLIISFLMKNHIYFAAETKDCIYTSNGESAHFYRDTHKFKKISDLKNEKIAKIAVLKTMNKLSSDRVNEIIRHLKKLYKDIHIVKGRPGEFVGFDITHIEGTKQTALFEWMKLMNLDREDVVGVGDGYNDYPLLSACGVKVAMGDAPEELKAIADLVVPTQLENGLLEVFERYF